MFKIIKRLSVLGSHLQVHPRTCSSNNVAHAPSISVTPSLGMVDEQVSIRLSGLKPNDTVTLVATLFENDNKFESRCVYQADDNGEIDNTSSVSLGGTFKGML